ncbi:hypothetical protein FB45DRAFT_1050056 [Roridomyces roridus]|uniref:F-box domain-containing protein n=1 Tax=Roridomyces roridus TaxID=1738132 RepID=A0AAD7CIC9_9AGAR|nr:hypothetical protein FB45DRAFT_1050056 [Roridomyces roridus]
MSAQLEAQIEQISLEIERQKDVLQKLESDKIILQRQLNAERDPLARLPLEISSEIFLQCVPLRPEFPSGHSQPQPHLAPLLLLNVCHSWTDIALSTPALWASIRVGFPHPHPLQISLRGALASQVTSAVLGHSPQLQSLRLSFDADDYDVEDLGDRSYELLWSVIGRRIREELPCLQALEIFGRVDFWPRSLMWLPVRRLLDLSPNLTVLNIQRVVFSKNIDEEFEFPRTLVLAHLRHLTHLEEFDNMDISAPVLETLHAPTKSLFTESFISFLRQSPPLWKLKLSGGWDVGNLHDSLSLVPTLTHLESSSSNTLFVKELLHFLAQNTQIVPKLATLQIEDVSNDDDNSPIDILMPLASILSARRGGLQKIRLTTSSSIAILPENLAILRQFSADGLNIHVGVSQGPNILSFAETQVKDKVDKENTEESDGEDGT